MFYTFNQNSTIAFGITMQRQVNTAWVEIPFTGIYGSWISYDVFMSLCVVIKFYFNEIVYIISFFI